jgi:hypothetical protein
MSAKLVAHTGATYIDREGLKALETPQGTDTWMPIPHYDLNRSARHWYTDTDAQAQILGCSRGHVYASHAL